jgi:glycosyltransferase involved in cell wall biosynthesis
MISTSSHPLVSIITVSKNSDKTIDKTIESVLIQDYPNIEYWIQDGVSNDNTINIINKFIDISRKDESKENLTFKFISELDSGVYDAMNKAVKYIHGEYILFLNSDDRLLTKESVSNLINHLIIHNADAVAGEAKLPFRNHSWKPNTFTDFDFLLGSPSNHQSYICSKKMFDSLNGFNICYRYASDVDFMFRSINNGYKTAILNKSVVRYSLAGTSTKNLKFGIKELEQIMGKFLNEQNLEFVSLARKIFGEGQFLTEKFLEELISKKLSENQNVKILEFIAKRCIQYESQQSKSLSYTIIKFFKKKLIVIVKYFLSLLPIRYI